MKNLLILFCSLHLSGVFGDEVTPMSANAGDSVILRTNLTDIQTDDMILWKFNGESTILAKIDRETNETSIPGNNDDRFRDRLKLNHKTGDLTITHIKTSASGDYKMEISGSKEIKHTFRVSVIEVKSVMEGKSVTLNIDVTDIQSDNVKWKFNDTDLTDSRVTNSEVNHQTGDLIISNIRRDQTGVYRVEINNRGSITHKSFNITVMATTESSQRSHWETTGPVCLGVGVLLLIVLIVCGVLIYKLIRRD